MTNNPHAGADFDDFLREEGLYEECSAMTSRRSETIAIKRVLAHQLAEEMKQKKITKTEMATRMQTSRAQLDRLLESSSGLLINFFNKCLGWREAHRYSQSINS